jgi:hypothetical protein
MNFKQKAQKVAPANIFCDSILSMNKKLRELINGLGLVAAAVAMMAVGIAFIFLVSAVFHTNFK